MQGPINNQLYQAACYESNAAEAKYDAALEMKRPFYLLRPTMQRDGNQWCALYGENPQSGVAGFGDTPHAASVQFDIQWMNEKAAQMTDKDALLAKVEGRE